MSDGAPVVAASPIPRGLVAPPLVEGNPAALAYWRAYVEADTRGGLRTTDGPILARLCIALAYADDANARVAATGLLVQGPAGLPVPNPYLAVMNSQTDIAARLSAQLGVQIKGW